MIRPATEADIDAILALTESTGYFKPLELEALAGVLADYFAETRDAGHRAFVWDEAGRVLGYVYHAPEEMTDNTWCLWWIAVASDQQGRGLGAKLLSFAEDDIRAHGGRLIVVETADTPLYEPTRQVYLKRGYTAAGTVPHYYADDDGKAIFTKLVVSVSG